MMMQDIDGGLTCDAPPHSGEQSNTQGTDSIGKSLEMCWDALTLCLTDLQKAAGLTAGDILVVGASSSEVIGQHIGTSTSLSIGHQIVDVIGSFAAQHGFDVAFQCCEHLNRALVVERRVAVRQNLLVVQAIPVPGAGGAVAAEAYRTFANPCLVENISADAGIDIGDTLIGMHLKRVAVPVRGHCSQIGMAHVTMARTRPPLIGGNRAVYDLAEAKQRLEQPSV